MDEDADIFPVCATACAECLFSPQRIVSAQRAQRVIREARRRDTTFLCHRGGLVGRQITCAAFYARYPGVGQLRRVAERLGVVRFVPVPEKPGPVTD